MSYVALAEHPDCLTLMSIAFTAQMAKSEGESLVKLNPEFYTQIKAKMDAEEKVRKSVMSK